MADENNDPKNNDKKKKASKTGNSNSNEPTEEQRESEGYVDAAEEIAEKATKLAGASETTRSPTPTAAPASVSAPATDSTPAPATSLVPASASASAPVPASAPMVSQPSLRNPLQRLQTTSDPTKPSETPKSSRRDSSLIRNIQNNIPNIQRLQPNELNQRPVLIIMKRENNSTFNPFSLPLQQPNAEGYETLKVGRTPTQLKCPVCSRNILTMVVHEPKYPKCLLCFLLCTLPCCCCCWPCVCLPYCMDSCQNANHYCPNCNAYVGTFEN